MKYINRCIQKHDHSLSAQWVFVSDLYFSSNGICQELIEHSVILDEPNVTWSLRCIFERIILIIYI